MKSPGFATTVKYCGAAAVWSAGGLLSPLHWRSTIWEETLDKNSATRRHKLHKKCNVRDVLGQIAVWVFSSTLMDGGHLKFFLQPARGFCKCKSEANQTIPVTIHLSLHSLLAMLSHRPCFCNFATRGPNFNIQTYCGGQKRKGMGWHKFLRIELLLDWKISVIRNDMKTTMENC